MAHASWYRESGSEICIASSYIHYAMSIIRNQQIEPSHGIVPSNSLQLIASQSLSHPLLHQRSSRSGHFNFAVVDFQVAETQDARAINNIAVFLAITVAVAVAEGALGESTSCWRNNYRWKAILAVRQVILSPSAVYTSARTVYVP